jgi:hypothetical protein
LVLQNEKSIYHIRFITLKAKESEITHHSLSEQITDLKSVIPWWWIIWEICIWRIS